MDCSMKFTQYIFNDIPKRKCYDKIKKIEKIWSDKLYEAMVVTDTTNKTFILPKGLNGARIMKAMMVRHFPYTWYMSQWYSVVKMKDGTKEITILRKPFEYLDEKNTEVRWKIIEIIEELGIMKGMDDYQVARMLTEYIAEHTEYRYKDDELGYQAWDCLCNNSCICCGYAEGFKALCDYVGIKCVCMTSEDHEWNRVKINGEWLNNDVCWVAGGANKSIYMLSKDDIFYANHMTPTRKIKSIWKYTD